jgi:hypothetical protein
MGLFRKKLPLATAIGTAQRAALSRDAGETLREIGKNDEMTDADFRSMIRELPKLELAVLQVLFWVDAQRLMSDEDFGRCFGFELALAWRQSATGSSEAFEVFNGDVQSYLSSAFSRMESASISDAPVTFFVCQEFVTRVLGNVDLRAEAARNRHFQTFDVAKQTVHGAEEFIAVLQREYRFVAD